MCDLFSYSATVYKSSYSATVYKSSYSATMYKSFMYKYLAIHAQVWNNGNV